MKLKEVHAHEPFILPYNGKYYLYYSNYHNDKLSISLLISDDLDEWKRCETDIVEYDDFSSMPCVIYYNGKFYLIATCRKGENIKSIYCFVSDRPDGGFTLYSKEPLTPPDWECIGGSIYFDKNNTPHLIFSHEWIQIEDGTVCEIELSKDLSHAVSEPRALFKASEYKKAITVGIEKQGYAADGPFMFRIDDNTLICAWSTISSEKYTVVISKSDNGEIDGNWTVCQKPFATVNGGHGMFFKDFSGNYRYVMHKPNVFLSQKAVIYDFSSEDGFKIIE